MNDAQKIQPFLDQLVKITKYGVGYENDMRATMVSLPVAAWIEPYIHQNVTELFTNLATAVQNKFISRRTASERISMYAKNDEYARIIEEEKEKQQMDLLVQLQAQDNQTENAIAQEEASARINHGKSGNDVNTGHSGKAGRPNKSGKTWDSNNNNAFDDKNNWGDWNNKH